MKSIENIKLLTFYPGLLKDLQIKSPVYYNKLITYLSCQRICMYVCTRVCQKLALAPRPLMIYCASSFV
jgi:hypothetical protein